MYIKKHIFTKQWSFFQGISMGKDFEVLAIELVDYKYIIVCIHRSPRSSGVPSNFVQGGFNKLIAAVEDLGFWDYLAQISRINSGIGNRRMEEIA